MKAKIFSLMALVLCLVSCQTEPEGLDVIVGGEQEAVINVSLAEATRTSAGSGIENVDNNVYDLRYILEVYDTAGNTFVYRDVQTVATGVKTVSFPVRLIPERNYNFVVWADFVTNDSKADRYYNTADGLDAISIIDSDINPWKAMDETRDAYTGHEIVNGYNSGKSINITLTRPFGKMRIITTDIDALNKLNGTPMPDSITVTYTNEVYTAFDALTQTPMTEGNKSFTYDLENVYKEDWTTENRTLFTDYIFGTESGSIQFTMDVAMTNGNVVRNNFNTEIPVKRNYLTTITGDILTDGNNIKVDVSDDFENEENPNDPPYYQVAVSNGVELIQALMAGNEVIALNNITATYADFVAATRATTPVYPVINLNGFTITIENENAAALVNLNGGTLTVQGDGAIVSNRGALVEGTTVVTEGATVEPEVAVDENGDSTVKTGVEALAYICEKGGEFTFTENLAISEVLLASTTNPVVINGANFNLTSTATRAIRATVANANIVVNDLNVVVETERVGSNDIRGISVDNVTGVELTLNNCSVIFNHPSGNDWAYAVNVTGGSNHNVTINGGTYNGANVINVRGEKQTVVVKNATLTSSYPMNDVYYGACIYVVQEQGSSVYAEGNTFNGDNAIAFNIGTGTALEEKNNTDNTKLVAAKVNGAYYYNIAEAINAAEDGATVTVLHNHDCNVGATVPAGKSLTIDLNEKTVKGTDTITGSFGLITNKGNLLVKNGTMTLKAENNRGWNAYSSVISNNPGGNLVVENATIEHLGGTDMAYGIDNLTNGKGTSAIATVNEGAVVKSTYRAIRQFLNGIEATNELYVNAGAVVEGANKSIWMQDPSANANTGKLVVNEGATLNGDVYLFVCAGSTSWPVEVSIAASAVTGEVLTGNVPAGYDVVEENGVWVVKAYEVVANGLYKKDAKTYLVMNAEGLAALNAMMVNKTAGTAVKVTLGADIDFAGKTWTPVDSHADTNFTFNELNGNGYTISNLTINGQAMFTRFAGTGDVTIKDVTFDNANVNSKGNINTSILTGHTYQNVLLDNVDVKNSTIIGGYKVAPLIATVYNEGASTITATLKNCDVENTVVKATSYDFCTTGMVAFVYEDDNDRIVFENCSVKDVQLYAPNVYTAHAAIYTAGSETLYNEAEGVVVENVTFENI